MRIAAVLLLITSTLGAGCMSGTATAPAVGAQASPPVAPAAGLTLPASFAGTLPCADCEGIDYRLDLFPDRSFFLRTTYRGRSPGSFDDVGSFDVSSDGRALIAQGGREPPLQFSIESADELRLLDPSGQPLDSGMNHALKRVTGLAPLEPTLELRGMYRYMADAAIFEECTTGRRLPVAMEADNVALERGYLELSGEPGAPVMARVEGRIAQRMPVEGPGPVSTLVPERFLGMAPGETCPPRFATAPLAGTAWQLVSLGGEAVTPAEGRPRPTMTLDAVGARAAGSDGCNRFMGSYTLTGDTLAFGQIASTMMACAEGMDVAQRFTTALGATGRYRALGEHLDLYDSAGTLLACLEARPVAD